MRWALRLLLGASVSFAACSQNHPANPQASARTESDSGSASDGSASNDKAQPSDAVAGGMFLILSCDVKNFDQNTATQTAIGCSVKNNDGTAYAGTIASLSAKIYAKGQGTPLAAKATLAPPSSAHQIEILVDHLAPGDASTVTLNGSFNGTAETLSAALDHTVTFTTGPIDLYIDAAGSKDADACSKNVPCATIARALALVPQAIYHRVTLHIAAGDYKESVVITGKIAGGLAGAVGSLHLVGEAKGFVEHPDADCMAGVGPTCFHILTPDDANAGVLVSGFSNQSQSDYPFDLRNAVVTGSASGSDGGVSFRSQSAGSVKNVRIEKSPSIALLIDGGASLDVERLSVQDPVGYGIELSRGSSVNFSGSIDVGIADAANIGVLVTGASQLYFDENRGARVTIHFATPATEQTTGGALSVELNSTVNVPTVEEEKDSGAQSSLTIINASSGISVLSNSSFESGRMSLSVTGALTALWASAGGQIRLLDDIAPEKKTLALELTLTAINGKLLYATDAGSQITVEGNVDLHLCNKAPDVDATSVVVAVVGAQIDLNLTSGFGAAAYASPTCTASEAQASHKITVGPGAQIIVGDPSLAASARATGNSFFYP